MTEQKTDIIQMMNKQNILLEEACKSLTEVIQIGISTTQILNEQDSRLKSIDDKLDLINDNIDKSNNTLNKINKRNNRWCSIM